MKYVFNELSTTHIAPSISIAHRWMNTFFEICKQSEIRTKTKISIVTTLKFSALHLHSDTSFTNWVRTIQDVDFRRKILAMVTKDQIKIDYPYYYYENNPCQGLGVAFEKEHISISYGPEYWANHELNITREQFDTDGEVTKDTLKVNHVASMEHLDIYVPIRKFKHNPKHDRVRPIANKDEDVSILECSNEWAFELLCKAVGEITANDKQLFYFDETVGKYIIFYRHADQEYHAYHTNDENEISHSVKEEIARRLKET